MRVQALQYQNLILQLSLLFAQYIAVHLDLLSRCVRTLRLLALRSQDARRCCGRNQHLTQQRQLHHGTLTHRLNRLSLIRAGHPYHSQRVAPGQHLVLHLVDDIARMDIRSHLHRRRRPVRVGTAPLDADHAVVVAQIDAEAVLVSLDVHHDELSLVVFCATRLGICFGKYTVWHPHHSSGCTLFKCRRTWLIL